MTDAAEGEATAWEPWEAWQTLVNHGIWPWTIKTVSGRTVAPYVTEADKKQILSDHAIAQRVAQAEQAGRTLLDLAWRTPEFINGNAVEKAEWLHAFDVARVGLGAALDALRSAEVGKMAECAHSWSIQIHGDGSGQEWVCWACKEIRPIGKPGSLAIPEGLSWDKAVLRYKLEEAMHHWDYPETAKMYVQDALDSLSMKAQS